MITTFHFVFHRLCTLCQDFDDPDHMPNLSTLEVDDQALYTDAELPEIWKQRLTRFSDRFVGCFNDHNSATLCNHIQYHENPRNHNEIQRAFQRLAMIAGFLLVLLISVAPRKISPSPRSCFCSWSKNVKCRHFKIFKFETASTL